MTPTPAEHRPKLALSLHDWAAAASIVAASIGWIHAKVDEVKTRVNEVREIVVNVAAQGKTAAHDLQIVGKDAAELRRRIEQLEHARQPAN